MSARRFYLPPSNIGESAHVRHVPDGRSDFYSGAKDDLVAIGLLPSSLFPGEPGMPSGSVRLWPHGAPRNKGGYDMPGRMTVHRTASGKFQIRLSVSLEERERRERAQEAKREAKKSREQTATACAMQPELIDEVGRMFLRDSVQALGLPRVVALVDAMRGPGSGCKALADMGMLHRRKLPAGWRVIEGQRPA